MTEHTVRTLSPSDREIYQTLRIRAVREHPEAFLSSLQDELDKPVQVMESRLSHHNGAAVHGAFDATGQLVGVCGLGRLVREKTRHKASIWGMYVADEHRGRGLGRRLLRAALDHARKLTEVELVELSVNATNTAARALYVSEGFISWGVEADAFRVNGVPQNEDHMHLSLRR